MFLTKKFLNSNYITKNIQSFLYLSWKIPSWINLKIFSKNSFLTLQTNLYSINLPISNTFKIYQNNYKIFVKAPRSFKNFSYLRLLDTLFKNTIKDLLVGFKIVLNLQGYNYKVETKKEDNKILLSFELGFSHYVSFVLPSTFEIEYFGDKRTLFSIKGYDRIRILNIAYKIKRLRPPNCYTGSGVFFLGEILKRKEGKR